MKFQLKPAFLVCFCDSFMEGDEGNIFSKPPDWKSLFVGKIKIKNVTKRGCLNEEYDSIFE